MVGRLALAHCWLAGWRWHCSRPLGAGGLRPLGAGATMARVSGRHLHMHIHICMYVAPVLTWTCSNRSHLCSQSAAWRSLHCLWSIGACCAAVLSGTWQRNLSAVQKGDRACMVRSAGERTPDRSSDVATKRTPWTHDASSAARLCSAKLVSSASPSLRLSAEKNMVRAPADTASAAAACGSVAPADTASAAAACGSEAPAETASAAAAGGSVAPEAPAMFKARGWIDRDGERWSQDSSGSERCH